jgi:hypothetical protein
VELGGVDGIDRTCRAAGPTKPREGNNTLTTVDISLYLLGWDCTFGVEKTLSGNFPYDTTCSKKEKAPAVDKLRYATAPFLWFVPSGRIARDSNARRRSHLVWAPPHRIFLLENPAPAFDSLIKQYKNKIITFAELSSSGRRM